MVAAHARRHAPVPQAAAAPAIATPTATALKPSQITRLPSESEGRVLDLKSRSIHL